MDKTYTRFGPSFTPLIIKIFVSITICLSILISLINYFFPALQLPYYMALNIDAVRFGFVWQFLIYPFLIPSLHISTGFFLHLAVNSYLFWVIGSSLIERTSLKQFLFLLGGTWLVTALIAIIILSTPLNNAYFCGNTAILFSLLVGFMMLNPHSKISLFHTISLRTKWVILVFLGLTLIIDLSNRDFISFFTYLFSALYAYFFSLIIWNTRSYITFLERFETKLIRLTQHHQLKRKKIFVSHPNLNDEEFMDAMLKKISSKGKKSLTWLEKRRMKKISTKKHPL